MKIQTKIGLLCLTFFVPIVVLTKMVADEKDIAINFSQKEIDGMEYEIGIDKVYRLAGDRRFVTNEKQTAAIEEGMKNLAALEAKWTADMMTKAEFAAVKAAWDDTKAHPEKRADDKLLDALGALVSRMGDKSNLILDPDLDTYYEMDITLLRYPVLVNLTGELMKLANTAIDTGKVTPDQKTEFIVQRGLLKSALEGTNYSTKVAFENEALNGVPLKKRTGESLAQMNAALKVMMDDIDRDFVNSPKVTVGRQATIDRGMASLNAIDRFYADSSAGLVEGMQNRVKGFTNKKDMAFIVVTAISLLAFAFALFIWRSVRPIKAIAAILKEIATGGGDLSKRLPDASNDEIGETAKWFNKFMDQLTVIVTSTTELAREVAGTATALSANAQEHEAGAVEQSAAVSQVTQAANGNANMARGIATSANGLSQSSEEMLKTAQGGRESVERTRSSMEEIVRMNGIITERINSLYEQSQAIINVVDIIDSVTDRLDLLALNASLEGSRAGDAGKGFSLVAQEMRRLAENVSESTSEIKGTIQEIHRFTQAAREASAKGEQTTRAGETDMRDMATAIERIFGLIDKTARGSQEITMATQSQLSSIEQMVQALGQIGVVTNEGLVATKEVTLSAAELNKIAGQLTGAVGQFKIGEQAPRRQALELPAVKG